MCWMSDHTKGMTPYRISCNRATEAFLVFYITYGNWPYIRTQLIGSKHESGSTVLYCIYIPKNISCVMEIVNIDPVSVIHIRPRLSYTITW